jgi:hypothetical protein
MSEILNLKEDFCDTDEGCYLILINPENIPHLVYLQDGRYYSLTYKGVELGFSFSPYLERLIRLKKKIVFIEVQRNSVSPFQLFSDYIAAGNENSTCFYPIKDILLPESKSEMIYELIPELYMNGLIKGATHFGMKEDLNEAGNFEMNEYSKEDILAHIADLKSNYVER